ncbi:hypothetical protein CDAR_38601 [Caerostris darwini]|uniref:Uncharacterized protein n=1 Tax=Caerostris darwini TaxID=1538125 RepID=A0AAV4UQC5_9ARAC|nr:hypothetical protein CDAR_38601 [Caerostris darwini]
MSGLCRETKLRMQRKLNKKKCLVRSVVSIFGAADTPPFNRRQPQLEEPPKESSASTSFSSKHPTKRSATFRAVILVALCRFVGCEQQSSESGRDDQQESGVIVGGERCCLAACPRSCSSPSSHPLPCMLQVRSPLLSSFPTDNSLPSSPGRCWHCPVASLSPPL